MSARLSVPQIDQFRRDGYVLFKQPVFPAADFQRLRRHFEALQAEWIARGNRPEHMDMPHMSDRSLFDWLLHDSVLDVVESVIGPNIALWASHFIAKPAGTGMRVPWHEDSAYWGTVLQPMEVVTVWLAIDPSDAENGCMRLIPGSHTHGYSQYEKVTDAGEAVFDAEVKRGAFDESSAVDCVLDPNECSLHHAKMIHGSNANTSTRRRCGYTMRYISTASTFDHSKVRRGHQIFLARGRDLAGNTYGDPAKVQSEWDGPTFAAAR